MAYTDITQNFFFMIIVILKKKINFVPFQSKSLSNNSWRKKRVIFAMEKHHLTSSFIITGALPVMGQIKIIKMTIKENRRKCVYNLTMR